MENRPLHVESFDDIEKDIYSWRPDELVVIKAYTGMGKSTFIMERLYTYAKENAKTILLLVHRKNCLDQFQLELDRFSKRDVIELMTYQYIQSKLLSGEIDEIGEFDYIVSDEFHYFLSDSKFNNETDISFEWIMKQENSVKIFMSATADNMARYLRKSSKNDICTYELPTPKSMIDAVYFYTEKNPEYAVADMAVKTGNKTIMFMQSVRDAYLLYLKYKDNAIFCCSKQNKDYGRFTKKKVIEKVLYDQKFDSTLLITTSCLDSGISLKDEAIKFIFSDIEDPQIVLQCIGRKRRVDDKDTVSVILPYRDKKWMCSRCNRENKEVEQAKFLLEHGSGIYATTFGRSMAKSGIIYPVRDDVDQIRFTVNDLMYQKYQDNIETLKTLIQDERKDSYCRYLVKLINPDCEKTGDFNYEIIEDDRWREYIYENIGKKYTNKKEKEELIQAVGFRVRTARKINEMLIARGSLYGIREYRSTRRKKATSTKPAIKESLRCWQIVKMEFVTTKVDTEAIGDKEYLDGGGIIAMADDLQDVDY